MQKSSLCNSVLLSFGYNLTAAEMWQRPEKWLTDDSANESRGMLAHNCDWVFKKVWRVAASCALESVQKLQVFLSFISYKCLLHVFCGKKEIVPQIIIVSSRGDDFINIPLRFKQLLNKSFTWWYWANVRRYDWACARKTVGFQVHQ